MESNGRIGLYLIISVLAIGSILLIPDASGARDGYIINLLLRAMHDVNITNPTDGQVLTYDGTYWVNENITGGVDTTDCVNLGNQYQLVLNSTNGDCYIRSLANGTGITLQSNATHIMINATSSGDTSAPIGQIAFYVFQSVTKTNLATSYTAIYVNTFDEDVLSSIDFANIEEVRVIFAYDYVGASAHQCRWVNRALATSVLYESPTFTADQTPSLYPFGSNTGDSGWFARPAGFSGELSILWQCKSANGTDDPIPKGYIIYVR